MAMYLMTRTKNGISALELSRQSYCQIWCTGGCSLGLTAQVARALNDRRQRAKVRHEVVVMVRQRVHAVASGYGDLNDHDALHHDEVAQTACERDESLASASTLCRFERRAERQWAVAIHQVLVEQFIASHRRAPPVTDPFGLRPSPPAKA